MNGVRPDGYNGQGAGGNGGRYPNGGMPSHAQAQAHAHAQAQAQAAHAHAQAQAHAQAMHQQGMNPHARGPHQRPPHLSWQSPMDYPRRRELISHM